MSINKKQTRQKDHGSYYEQDEKSCLQVICK